MDKEKILPKLTEMVGKTSLSERTISDYAASVASLLTDETQLTEEFYTAHVNVLKSMDGNFSRDVAAQVEEAKKNLPNPQTPPVTPPEIQPAEEKPQWAKELDAKLNALVESQQNAQKQAQQNQLIESIRKRATTKDAADEKSGWATNAGLLETAIRLTRIDDTDTLETAEQKYQQEYNSLCKNLFGSIDAVPGAGGGKNDTTADWATERKRLQDSGRLPKD